MSPTVKKLESRIYDSKDEAKAGRKDHQIAEDKVSSVLMKADKLLNKQFSLRIWIKEINYSTLKHSRKAHTNRIVLLSNILLNQFLLCMCQSLM